jgi:exodeoxyribonuclease VII large subunit
MPEANEIFTLRQVVQSIRKTIEERYQRLYWVKAEMHRLNRFASGHCFPELLQKEDGKIVAEMRGTIWKQNFERINARFIEVVKEPLREDTTLLMQVRVTFHETYGLSLQILDVDPNYALGELQRERQETLKKLQEEGLLNANQLLDFPLLPKRIAVISAEASKGLSDFYKIIHENEWTYSFFTLLFPAYLQGDLAAQSIVEQLERIQRVQHHFDAVVIVRGGGGEIGLSCYNNYALCKAICTFPLPVLTGIGHSSNLTVAEMVAYRNAITPTELGEFLLQAFHNFSVPVRDASRLLKIRALQILEREQGRFAQLSSTFRYTSKAYLSNRRELLLRQAQLLRTGSQNTLQLAQVQLQKKSSDLQTSLRYQVQKENNRLDQLSSTLPVHTRAILRDAQALLENHAQVIRLTDPQHVLQRGYSIALFRGKSVSVDNLPKKGDVLVTITATHTLHTQLSDDPEEKEIKP